MKIHKKVENPKGEKGKFLKMVAKPKEGRNQRTEKNKEGEKPKGRKTKNSQMVERGKNQREKHRKWAKGENP